MERMIPDRRAYLKEMSRETLMDYIDVLSRNFWTVQNNWMANVTVKCGNEEAAVFDELLWDKWPKVEAYRFKKLFNLGNTLADVEKVMTLSLAAEEGPTASFLMSENRLEFKISDCPMQKARLTHDWPELNCKPAFTAMWKAISGVINPDIKVERVYAPSDPHPDDDWCGAVLTLET